MNASSLSNEDDRASWRRGLIGQWVMKRVWHLIFGLLFGLEAVVSAQAEPALIAKGEQVYIEKKCAICHAFGGNGGRVGPDLSEARVKRDLQWLKNLIRHPKATNPKAKMLPFRDTEEELKVLVTLLGSLK